MELDRAERRAFLLILVVAALLLYMRLQPSSALEKLDFWFYDAVSARFLGDPPSVDDVTVVLVDDETLERLGERWPMDRLTWAKFFRTVGAYKPGAVGVDAWFESPAPRGEVELAMDLADRIRGGPLGQDTMGQFLLFELDGISVNKDGDRQFAEALAANGRVVLGVACLSGAEDTLSSDLGVPLPKLGEVAEARLQAMRCANLSGSLPQLAMSARSQAGLMVLVDDDGKVRRYPYRFGTKDGVHPTLALGVALAARPARVEELKDRAAEFGEQPPFLHYDTHDHIRTVRLSDVIEAGAGSEALRSAFEDKLVFVGVSALGTEDYRSSTIEHDIPGVYVHANAAASLLADRWIRSSGGPVLLYSGVAFVLLILLGLLGLRMHSPAWIFVAPLGASFVWLFVAALALRGGWFMPVGPLLIGIAGWLVVKGGYQLWRLQIEKRRAKEIRNAFQHYLSPAVVEALVENPSLLALGGERREITAFFSDVAGFTTISESMEPGDLVQLLNECLGAMTDIIIEEGGTVDKYIGDAIVAMFGAPLEQPDHAIRACVAALRCQEKLAELQPSWLERGMPEVVVRIGLNTGPALVGNMGSAARFDYTMLGDTVNLAARLESANKTFRSLLLIGSTTHAAAGHGILCREADKLVVKGKTTGIPVFQPVAIAGEATAEHRQQVETYEAALALYRAQKWEEASAAFGVLADAGDGTAAVLMERIPEMREADLSPDWDGTYTMKTK
jgi:adenylate cyclase